MTYFCQSAKITFGALLETGVPGWYCENGVSRRATRDSLLVWSNEN